MPAVRNGPVLSFAGGPVVSPDVEEQGVVGVAESVQFVGEPADLDVDVFGVSGGHLHQASLERLLVLGDAVPGRQRSVALGELAVGGNPAFLLGPLEDALAVGVPSVVELARVFVGPFLHDVVRAVQAPLAQYMKNGLSG